MSLEKLRQEIDHLDIKLVNLLNERARVSLQIFKEKQRLNLPIHNPERESQVRQKAILENRGPLSTQQIASIFQAILESCRSIQLNQKGM